MRIEISGADYGVLVDVEDGEGEELGEAAGVVEGSAVLVSAITCPVSGSTI